MKPGLWWRAQNNCVDSAKLILLNDRAHRNWFNLNCIANAHGGVLPSLETVAVKLRVSEARAAAAITELVGKRLFDQREDGSFVPHDWNEWQFKTDVNDMTNAERQKRHRAKHRAELREMKALLTNNSNALRNGKRNGVTDVMAKRPETETDITPTGNEGRRKGLSDGSMTLSSEALAGVGGRKQ